MANKSSSNSPGSTNAPAGSSSANPGSSGASGTSSGANVPGMGPVTVIKPPTGFERTVQQLVFGTEKDLPAAGGLPMHGTQVTQAQILGTLQPVLDAFTAVVDAEKAVKQARFDLSALLPSARTFVANVKDALIAFFGRGSPILADFGVKDRSSRRKTTVVAKAAAKVKSSETRVLRNTQGKAKKLAVKFTGQVLPPTAVKPAAPGSGNSGGTPPGTTGAAQ